MLQIGLEEKCQKMPTEEELNLREQLGKILMSVRELKRIAKLTRKRLKNAK